MSGLILSAFTPIFALIALGYAIRATGLMPTALWAGVNALNHRVLLPAFLFALIARIDLRTFDTLSLLLASVLGSVALFALAWFASGLIGVATRTRAPLVSVAVLWNLVLTQALIEGLLGDGSDALASAVILPGVVLGVAFTILMFSLDGPQTSSLRWSRFVRDPVLLACLAGLLLALTGFADRLDGLLRPFEMLGTGSIAVIVLAMGAGLDFQALRGKLMPLALAAGLRSVVGPIVFIAIALAFSLEREGVLTMAVAGAAPGAAVIFAVAANLDGDTKLSAGMLTLSVLVSAITLPLAAAFVLYL